MIIDCPWLTGTWTPVGRDRIDLSNAVEPDTPPTTSLSWTERAAQAAEVLARAERDALVAAFLRQYPL